MSRETSRRIKKSVGKDDSHASQRSKNARDGRQRDHRVSQERKKKSTETEASRSIKGSSTGKKVSRDSSKIRDSSYNKHDSRRKPSERRSLPKTHSEEILAKTPQKTPPKGIKEDMNQEDHQDVSPGSEMEYEDDFEEYEEDFESEEEDDEGQDGEEEEEEELILVDKKMDSGNYDLTPQILKEITEVKNAMFEENNYNSKDLHSSVSEPMDPRESKSSPPPSVFNFNAAKQRKKEMDKSSKTKKRGRELLSMIRLDAVNLDILNIPPVSYEKFMTIFGKGRQAITQTGHDDMDKEVQCEDIESTNKWTQFPPPVRFDSSVPIRDIIKGVGGDMQEGEEIVRFSNHPRLDEFIKFGGNVILTLMEEKQSQFYKDNSGMKQDELSLISTNRFSLPISTVPCLKTIICLRFAKNQPYLLITCHYDLESKSSYLAIWNLNAPSDSPALKILSVRGYVSTFCTSSDKTPVVIAGLNSGIVVLWDLKEEQGWHEKGGETLHRSPTYIDDTSHESSVTAILPLHDEVQNTTTNNTFQIVSVEEKSKLIIWTVLAETYGNEEFVGLAHWGSIRLVQTTVLQLSEKGDFRDICTDAQGKRLFVGADDGQIHHFYRRDTGFRRPTPGTFKPEIEDLSISCNQVYYSLMKSTELIFGAYDDGQIRVYNIKCERPILEWPAMLENVHPLLEMKFQPSVAFILDTESRIHCWRISERDIALIGSVTIPQVVSIDLNTRHDENIQSLMAVGLANGDVEILTLKHELHSGGNKETFKLNHTLGSLY